MFNGAMMMPEINGQKLMKTILDSGNSEKTISYIKITDNRPLNGTNTQIWVHYSCRK